MPRKRSRPVKHPVKQSKHNIVDSLEKKTKSRISNRKVTITVVLIGIFLMTLMLNSYFNFVSGEAYNPDGETLGTRYFLSGPDPYYNMRLCEETLETGSLPYTAIDDSDPMLNYPLGGRGFRPPLFNMIAVATASFLEFFMSSIDALGLAMLFLPAIYGALSIFPIYFIGKELLNWKVGLVAALLIPLTPIFISSGHGSSLSLFDHDSFLFLLSSLLVCFTVLGLRRRNIIFGGLVGLVLTALYNTWTAAEFFFVVLIAYTVVIFIMNNLRNKTDMFVYKFILIAATISFVLSIPLEIIRGDIIDFPLFLMVVTSLIIGFDYVRMKMKVPWLMFVPFLALIAIAGLVGLYFINLGMLDFMPPMFHSIATNLFGNGIYGSQISTTIAEAKPYNLSYTVMSFGPVVYWLFLAGFVLFCYKLYKDKWSDFDIFMVTFTIIDMWLLATAGRFLNDLVLFAVIFAGYMITVLVTKLNMKEIIRNIKQLDSIKKIPSIMKVSQLVIILFICCGVLIPNAFMSMDAATPYSMKAEMFGEDYEPAFGLSLGKSMYWADACYWISQQDTAINKSTDRPAVISWWDYGFYLSSMSKHPTVADNFQEGISAAANFKTAQTENEAIAVLCIRILTGEKEGPKDAPVIEGKINQETKDVISKYFDNSTTDIFINKLEYPLQYCKTYDTLIAPEYDNTVYRVDWENAMYHELTDIIIGNLSLAETVDFYSDIQETTGHSIRYYATESYDKQIFGIFPFLADKGTQGFSTYEDDFYETRFQDSKTGVIYTKTQIDEMSDTDFKKLSLSPVTYEKQAYYESMWYKVFNGMVYTGQGTEEQRIPTLGLKHFYLDYFTSYVVIVQYYECYQLHGYVFSNNQTYDNAVVRVYDKYGISHDSDTVQNGQFDVLLPKGNVSIVLFMDDNQLTEQHYLDDVTEAEAKRIVTNTREPLYFDIPTATFFVNVTGLNETVNLSVISKNFDTDINTQISENNIYTYDRLTSDTYTVTLTNQTGSTLYSKSVFVTPGNNTLNVGVE